VSKRSIDRVADACSQGIPFFEKVLPALGKAIYMSLETGILVHEWNRETVNCWGNPVVTYPEFLKELFCHVYFGNILKEPFGEPLRARQVQALHKLLQLTMVFYKVERTASDDVVQSVVEKFLNLQPRLAKLEQEWDENDRQFLSRVKRRIGSIIGDLDLREITPRHGPGAVFGSAKPHEKWQPFPYYEAIEQVYPCSEYQYASASHLCDQGLPIRERIGEPLVRITTVPKNADTVRMIAVEERYPQFIKLGQMDSLYSHVRKSHIGKYVNFLDQTINHEAARLGSIDRSLATLDLEAASDTVSLSLVKRVIPRALLRYILPLRASQARWKGQTYPLQTFATMGSALCFPIEALVFWGICAEVCKSNAIIVFGDDIILPSNLMEEVVGHLERFGMTVSRRKTYSLGLFRESCGEDFYHGIPVSVSKWRKPPERLQSIQSKRGLFAAQSDICAFLNDIRRTWGQSTTDQLYHEFGKLFGFVPGTTKEFSAGKAVVLSEPPAANDVFLRRRWCKSTQVYKYRLIVERPNQVRVQDSWYEVFRSLTGNSNAKESSLYDDPKRTTLVWSWVEL
jgi:hypothetical protein